MKKIKPKVCPKCSNDMDLRAISSFDSTGERFGCIWYCQFCFYHNLGDIISVDGSNRHLVKPAVSDHEIIFVRSKIKGVDK